MRWIMELIISTQSVSEKSFPQSANPTLRYILPSFGCRSPLRRPHSDKISHKLGLAAHEKPFSDTLQRAVMPQSSRKSEKHWREEERNYSIISTLTPDDTKGKCVYCKHCHPCPAGIDIGLVNKYYDLSRLGDTLAKEHYKRNSQ